MKMKKLKNIELVLLKKVEDAKVMTILSKPFEIPCIDYVNLILLLEGQLGFTYQIIETFRVKNHV